MAQLTEGTGLHPSAIRQHLLKLIDAGLVEGRPAPPSGRGRPRLTYRAIDGIDQRWLPEGGAYEQLALLLAETVRTGDDPVDVGIRHGRTLARAPRSGGDPVDVITAEMRRLGFDPASSEADGVVDIALQSCPYLRVAVADPVTVCALHHGIALGVAHETHGVAIESLSARDPRHEHCHLLARRT